MFPHARRLENTHSQEVKAKERNSPAETVQKAGTICDNRLIIHKEADQRLREEEIDSGYSYRKGHRNFDGECRNALHPLRIPTGIIIADERHDALRHSHRNIGRHHIDFLSNSHGGHSLCAKSGGKIIQHGHACYIEKILDCSRNTNRTHTCHNRTIRPEHLGIDANIGTAALAEKKNKEVETSHAVGKESRQTRSFRSQIESPGKNKNRIKDNIQQAAAHRADAGMHGGAFRTDKIRHNDIQNGRRSAKCYRPLKIRACRARRFRAGSEKNKERLLECRKTDGEQHSADHRTVKTEGRALVHNIEIFPAKGTAHHTRAANTEEIVNGVKSKQHRSRKSDGSVLNRVIEHPDKISVGKIVNDHDKRAEDCWNRQLHHSIGNGRLFKQLYLTLILHAFSSFL